MRSTDKSDLFMMFPSVLREKLLSGTISFPEDICFDYEPILAYRSINRDENDYTPVSKKDMKSYFELRKKPRGVENPERDADYYAISLNKSIEDLKILFAFPNPKKKIAQGYIFKEGGPQRTKKQHISWWLFENVDFSHFIIKDEENG